MFEYQKICKELLGSLPERTKDIISRRFGILKREKETLESIGEEYGITRERVRQIERDGTKQAKKKADRCKEVFSAFNSILESFGGLKRENILVDFLSRSEEDKNCVIFLLNIGDGFVRFPESKDTHAFWTNDKKAPKAAEKAIEEACKILKKKKKLLPLEELKPAEKSISKEELESYLEISKSVVRNSEGVYGFYNWPEISPRGIKDRAYLVFKKEGRPLHFREVASLLGNEANPQTTHNELIKDSRFVLVGRGIYALSEWGYIKGEVKEVIRMILKEKGALRKDDIIACVTEQRIVKKNTIVQNLSNKKYFIRTPDGKYTIA